MNLREEVTITSPFGEEEICCKFTIDDDSNPFILRKVTVPDQTYTLGFYVKGGSDATFTVAGEEITVTTDWARHIVQFDATDTNLIFTFNTGVFYFYHTKLEIGNKDTDWSPSPEDIEDDLKATNLNLTKAESLIKQNAKAIALKVSEESFGELTGRVKDVELKLTSDGLTSIIGKYYTTGDEVKSTLKQTAEELTVKIENAAKTATNYLKYDGGLVVGEIPTADDETMGNNVQITTTGVNIRDGEAVLAKFEKNQIDLGCGDDVAAINLLNGIGSIEAVDNPDYNEQDLVIKGKMYVGLHSTGGVVGLNAEEGDYSAYVRCFTNTDSPMVGIYAVQSGIKSSSIRVTKDKILMYTGGGVELEGDMDVVGNIKANAALISGTLTCGDYNTNGGVKIYHDTPFIDFHFAHSSADYTSRIIENESGTLSCIGNWSVGGNIYCSGGAINMRGTDVALYGGKDNYYRMIRREYTSSSDHAVKLGNTNDDTRLFGANIYLRSTSTAVTSDKRLKKDFDALDRYESLFEKLNPVSYKYKAGTSGRTHIGFVAQEVKAAIEDNGLTTNDFAGFVESAMDKSAYIDDFGEEPPEDFTTEMSLRYDEFIALNTYMIQKLVKRVSELENQLSTMGGIK